MIQPFRLVPPGDLDVQELSILLSTRRLHQVYDGICSCLRRQVCPLPTQIRLQPLDAINQSSHTGGEITYTWADCQEGESFSSVRVGVLQGQHIQCRLRDLVRGNWHRLEHRRQAKRADCGGTR